MEQSRRREGESRTFERRRERDRGVGVAGRPRIDHDRPFVDGRGLTERVGKFAQAEDAQPRLAARPVFGQERQVDEPVVGELRVDGDAHRA